MTTAVRPLTISITTRNRPDRVIACLRSLLVIEELIARVIVLDDMSDQPLELLLRSAFSNAYPLPLTIIREDAKVGFILGRNKVARAAETEFIFNLDDDTVILGHAGVQAALDLIGRDPKVAAIAFAQGGADGKPYDLCYQPAAVDYPCQVPCFTGFAYLTRRETFVERLGGYRELLGLYGEEKEFGLRVLDAGYLILYLPSAIVAHVHDARGRDHKTILRQSVQSSCLQFICNQPLVLVLPGIVMRLLLYRKERRFQKVHDPWGTFLVIRWVLARLPAALRERKAVKWSTLRRWQAIRKSPPPYTTSTSNNGVIA